MLKSTGPHACALRITIIILTVQRELFLVQIFAQIVTRSPLEENFAVKKIRTLFFWHVRILPKQLLDSIIFYGKGRFFLIFACVARVRCIIRNNYFSLCGSSTALPSIQV